MPENLNENIIWIGSAGFEAHGDRVVVLQDEYRSGYECALCLDKDKRTIAGKEVSVVPCEPCAGTGRRAKAGNPNLQVKCSDCEGHGIVACPECGGKGGTIVLAENTKGRPTTGTIVSVGPDVTRWNRGDKCIYPSFAGHAYDLSGVSKTGKVIPVVLVILRDQEILSRMYGTLEQNQVKRSAALNTAA
jgi:co-chaperonin GroES (HSP10)